MKKRDHQKSAFHTLAGGIKHENCLITISRFADESLSKTLRSISTSRASSYFDVVIKLASGCSEFDINRLCNEAESLCLSGLVISCKDEGIYSAMNQALAIASETYTGYCWFINAGDFCGDGISACNDLLCTRSEGVDSPVIIGSVDILSTLGEYSYTYNWLPPPLCWLKPPLHASIIFPYSYWRTARYDEDLLLCADIKYIYNALSRCSIFGAPRSRTIAYFSLGGISSSKRSLGTSLIFSLQRIRVNFSSLPIWWALPVSVLDAARLIIRGFLPKA